MEGGLVKNDAEFPAFLPQVSITQVSRNVYPQVIRRSVAASSAVSYSVIMDS